MPGVAGEFGDACQSNAADPWVIRQSFDGGGGEHLGSGLVRAEPGGVDGDRECVRIHARGVHRLEPRGSEVEALLLIDCRCRGEDLGLRDVTCAAEPPVVPEASVGRGARPREEFVGRSVGRERSGQIGNIGGNRDRTAVRRSGAQVFLCWFGVGHDGNRSDAWIGVQSITDSCESVHGDHAGITKHDECAAARCGERLHSAS